MWYNIRAQSDVSLCIESDILNLASDADIRQQQAGDSTMNNHVGIAREKALKQQDAAKKESEQGGIIIIKAIYGVMNDNHQWVSQRNERDKTTRPCALDATVQLQFWVNNGSLRMPLTSKKNLLSFRNVLDCVDEAEWMYGNSFTKSDEDSNVIQSNMFQKAYQSCQRQWNEEEPEPTKSRRNLDVVLSVRYKYKNAVYDVTFLGTEDIELPSSRSKVVLEPFKSHNSYE